MNAFSAGKRHVNMIRDFYYMFAYTVKFMFVGFRNNKTQQIRC